MNLFGEILNQPELRFNFSSDSAKDIYSIRGLSRFGPYDSKLFQRDKINATIIYPDDSIIQRDALINGLITGEGSFHGFQSLFKVPLEVIEEIPFSTRTDIDDTINEIVMKSPDIVYVILQSQQSEIYVKAKARLLGNGIPSQMVTVEKLVNTNGREYTLRNIALASYAKVGGTPWTASTNNQENELILGISRAQDSSKKYLVGYVTLFTRDGDFLFMNSGAPVIEWDKYLDKLSELIERTLNSFEKEFEPIKGTPSSLVVHFHKKSGKKELEAIESGLKSNGRDIPYAIVHLNEFSNFRLFNSSVSSFVPQKGLKVTLSEHEALLLLDGCINGQRRKIGVPRVLDVRMDKRSTLEVNHFPSLVRQIYDFSSLNWRGFNSASIPVTLNYSKLIAKMVIELGIDSWNEIIAEGKLRDKAWFL